MALPGSIDEVLSNGLQVHHNLGGKMVQRGKVYRQKTAASVQIGKYIVPNWPPHSQHYKLSPRNIFLVREWGLGKRLRY